jgi:hypothetical protein
MATVFGNVFKKYFLIMGAEHYKMLLKQDRQNSNNKMDCNDMVFIVYK